MEKTKNHTFTNLDINVLKAALVALAWLFYFLDASAQDHIWTLNGDDISYLNGNVGIGTSSPAYPLVVEKGETVFNFRNVSKSDPSEIFSSLAIGHKGEGSASLGLDASNGDFEGDDHVTLTQHNDLSMTLSNRANQPMYFKTAGSTRLTITGDGKVGIGTDNPSATFQVERGTGSNTAEFRGTQRYSHFNLSTEEHTYIRGGKSNSNVLINDTGGNVGIGTSSPAYPLVVEKGETVFNFRNRALGDPSDPNQNTTQLMIGHKGEGNAMLLLDASNGDFSGLDYGYLTQKNNLSMELGNHANQPMYFKTAGSTRLTITGDGKVGIGTDNPSATFQVERGTGSNTAEFRGTQRYSHFNLSTEEHTYIRGGKSNSNVLINDTGGNVGIGTSSPAYPLVVEKGETVFNFRNRALGDPSDPNLNTTQLMIGHKGEGNVMLLLDASNGDFSGLDYGYLTQNNDLSMELGNHASQPMYFKTAGSTRLAITGDGKVGIGTSSPDSRLHVVGSNGAGESIVLDNKEIKFRGDGLAHYSIFANRVANSLTIENTSASHLPNTGGPIMMVFRRDGNVGIGTADPGDWKLAVNGKIRTKEIRVETGWADFVFEEDYALPTLQEVESHIREKGHLQDIPSAEEVAENGIFLGEMNAKLLQKIEELTLYLIAQDKENKAQKALIQSLQSRMEQLEKQ
ncbi:MAG: hypothetical protein AAGI25_14790 [Bacteroidota bacterium]